MRREIAHPDAAGGSGEHHVAGAQGGEGGDTGEEVGRVEHEGAGVAALAFGNLLSTLRAAGGIPEDLVSINLLLTDIPDYQAHGKEIGKAWKELAGARSFRRWPASARPPSGSRRR